MSHRPLHMISKLPVCFCIAFIWIVLVSQRASAVPPLVAGDVPTADKNHVEWYVGTRYQKTGAIERQIPFTEVVYGISDRQELTFEVPYLSSQGQEGFGDIVLGTKYLFLRETDQLPGVAGSFEWKLENGDEDKGLGYRYSQSRIYLRRRAGRPEPPRCFIHRICAGI